MADLRSEIRTAMVDREYTYERLLKESGLDLDVSSLNRKLNGAQPLSDSEALALALVFNVRAATVSRVIKLAESIGASVGWPALPREPQIRLASRGQP